MEETQEKTIFNFSYDDTSRSYIRTISTWMLINAVASLITVAISVITILKYLLGNSYFPRSRYFSAGLFGSDNLLIWFVEMVVIILMNVLLVIAYRHFRKSLGTNENPSMSKAWNMVRYYYRIYGVLLVTVVVLGIGFYIFILSFSRY